MAVLSKTGITTGATIQVGHVTQSVDAFTGAVQYDVILSGSLKVTGSVSVTGSITGSLNGNANTATYVVSTNQNYYPNPGSSWIGPGSIGILAGSVTLSSGISPILNPTALTGKTFQTQYWVTATKASGSTSPSNNAIMVEAIGPSFDTFKIRDIGASTNDQVNFIVAYIA